MPDTKKRIFLDSLVGSFKYVMTGGHGSVGESGEDLIRKVEEEFKNDSSPGNNIKRSAGYSVGTCLGIAVYLLTLTMSGYVAWGEELYKDRKKKKG